ncbi:MAG: helix-turn-helix transcriptional regulator [Bacteroidales bacterium]|jgi:transcriptional regulator with XRE-family HTH domain
MTDRILSIIKYFNLSPSDFAEKIGVQRSSISHLISGRNKPSLEFIQKIMSRFPEINPEWILNGNGKMLKIGINTELGILPFENSPVKNNNEEIKEPIKRESSRIQVKKRSVAPEERQVEKIIYLYKDKTFREYYPE